MARKKRPKVEQRELQGFKHIEAVAQLLSRLHEDGCARDKRASQLKKVQKILGCQRASLGSLSEATSVFDAERLPEIIGELAAQLKPLHHDPRLKDVQHALTLVDGSLLSALPKMAQAMLLRIVTNLLDVPAWVIALIYRYRWTIEVFFRFFKQVLGCRHLISHNENGIKIQTYCAIIACMP